MDDATDDAKTKTDEVIKRDFWIFVCNLVCVRCRVPKTAHIILLKAKLHASKFRIKDPQNRPRHHYDASNSLKPPPTRSNTLVKVFVAMGDLMNQIL